MNIIIFCMAKLGRMQIKMVALLVVLGIGLTACSGGASTQSNPNTQTATILSYLGPAPTSVDIQAFKNELWVNIQPSNRCGGCHNANGQSPNFARADDVNLAYDQVLQVVNLSQPELSRLVEKVAGGHNCWLSSTTACGDIMTTWIRNWAQALGNGGGGTQIQLVAPTVKDVGATKTFPTSSAAFASTVYPVLAHENPQYCARCHSPTAAVPQKPYFASNDVNEAYAESHSKINLDTPSLSRLVVRLREESHNCWSGDCVADANTMQTAIENFAAQIPLTEVDPALVVSKALTMYDGTIASGGNRYDTNIIARYEFKEGTGLVANDTSGVDPAANLTLSGSVTWVGGWGVTVANGGKAQAMTVASKKLSDRIKLSGEFSIEAWVAPANVAQEDAYIVSYSGGVNARNMTLAQRAYQYEAFTRSDKSDANGEASLLTSDDDRDAQASLQHVVLTYDPVAGRKLYVNGNFTGDVDRLGGGSLSDWDETFALVLGNETSSNRQWMGLIKFVAIHDRALTLDQVQQNFAAGVGEKYFVLFSVTELVNVPQSYVMFEVSQYDNYAYLFTKPTFISLSPDAQPGNIEIQGMRIGINGTEAHVGQAYIPLNVTISDTNYNSTTGQLLSNVGTVINLEKGPSADLFFLSFEKIGNYTHVVTENTVLNTTTPVDLPLQPVIGLRTFEEVDATFSKITGVPRTATTVKRAYGLVKQQLPTIESVDSFVSANQIGITQLGIAYCGALLDDATLRASFFPGLNPATATFATTNERNLLLDPLVEKVLGVGLSVQPDGAAVKSELNSLIDTLCPGGTCGPSTRTGAVVAKAVCTATLSSAAATLQ